MKFRILSVALLTGLAACDTAPRPAVLTDTSPETVAAVKGVLAAALGRAQIELGAGDLTQDPVISVLPPRPGPHEGNSPAVPALFDIVLMNGDCYVQERASGEMFSLTGIECRSVRAD